MAMPIAEPARKQRTHVRRTVIVGGLVAATVALGLMKIDIGGHDVGGSPAAAVLERAADVTITTSDPVVGPGQYLRVTTVEKGWGSPELINPDPATPPPEHIDEGPPIGSDGKPIVFQTLRTQHMWVPHDRAGTWVFDEESHTLRNISVDGEKYAGGEDHHVWTSKGGASTNWHAYSKYQDASLVRLAAARSRTTAEHAAQGRAVVRSRRALCRAGRGGHTRTDQRVGTGGYPGGLVPGARQGAAGTHRRRRHPRRRQGRDRASHGYAQELLFDQKTGQYIGDQSRNPDFPIIPGVAAGDPTSVTTVTTDVVDSAPKPD